MSSPLLPPPPDPPQDTHLSVLARVERWVAEHVSPEIADARIKAENAITAAGNAAPVLEEVASILGEIVKAPGAAPSVAALIPRAETVIAEAGKVAEMLAGTGL